MQLFLKKISYDAWTEQFDYICKHFMHFPGDSHIYRFPLILIIRIIPNKTQTIFGAHHPANPRSSLPIRPDKSRPMA